MQALLRHSSSSLHVPAALSGSLALRPSCQLSVHAAALQPSQVVRCCSFGGLASGSDLRPCHLPHHQGSRLLSELVLEVTRDGVGDDGEGVSGARDRQDVVPHAVVPLVPLHCKALLTGQQVAAQTPVCELETLQRAGGSSSGHTGTRCLALGGLGAGSRRQLS
eukprot:CAMPEP_0202916884 /NCGR_PEP_ID=MMETSP1392-20130828/69707_1 /ASSEMBLY_ACC=CAM_ASM_000868 /TAXON_ID=225041 /ORGANISM="Chlamydomonas chlamydogama, Strain SAG 11-48b" /LENGTH=163 /DNA_ID=CAMNT_0049609461 /DNA_START=456 /DNA_END=943 /DNA_ORIENTATION=+